MGKLSDLNFMCFTSNTFLINFYSAYYKNKNLNLTNFFLKVKKKFKIPKGFNLKLMKK